MGDGKGTRRTQPGNGLMEGRGGEGKKEKRGVLVAEGERRMNKDRKDSCLNNLLTIKKQVDKSFPSPSKKGIGPMANYEGLQKN